MDQNTSETKSKDYMNELEHAINKIENECLREKIKSLLADLTITIENKTYVIDLMNSPASKKQHHSFPSGLLIHTLATLKLAIAIAKVFEEMYHANFDYDLIRAGAILHDIMKPLTYEEDNNGKYLISVLGSRLDHISLAVAELYKRDFPLDVIHIVASHHGTGGQIWPKTVEAWIVHFADYIDSQLMTGIMQTSQNALKNIIKKNVKILSPRLMFEIVQTLNKKGKDALITLWEAKLKDNKNIKTTNNG